MARKQFEVVNYDTALVWAAAAAADRINEGNYVSDKTIHEFYVRDENGEVAYDPVYYQPKVKYHKNKDIFRNFLNGSFELLPEDYEAGEKNRNHIKTFSLKFLTGRISNFEQDALLAAEKEDWNSKMYLQLGALVYYPTLVRRDQKRQEVDTRVAFANSKHIGTINSRITLDVEILTAAFSEKWGTNFITAITNDDNLIRFSFRSLLTVGSKFSVTGTVKNFDNNGTTKLSRVKIN